MAGPCAGILLRRTLTSEEQVGVREELERLGAHFEVDAFRIEGRPFCVTFGPEYPGALFELDREGLSAVLEWSPMDEVGFCAMCNGERDHRMLAKLCAHFARKFDGVVDFGGRLPIGIALDGREPRQPIRVENPFGLTGVLLATTYCIAEGAYGTSHFGDAALVETWLQHPSFSMVK